MEQERITELLERYWQAETTVEEERLLAEYFRRADLPAEWEAWRDVFTFFEQESQIRSGPQLEKKIREHIHPQHPRIGRSFAWWAAAAVIMLGLGISLLFQPGPTAMAPTVMAGRVIKDTYDDPQQALAAVRKALFTASEKMNKGLHPLK